MAMPAAQMGSITTGHGCWPPTAIVVGTPTVIAEGRPLSGLGHPAIPHTCVTPIPTPTHPLVIALGSATVISEGIPIARVGDPMTCGDLIAVGAPTVIVGG